MFEPALAEQNNKMVLDQFSDTKTRKTNGSFAVKLFASHGVETSFPAVQCRVKTCRSECSRREDDPGDWKNAWRWWTVGQRLLGAIERVLRSLVIEFQGPRRPELKLYTVNRLPEIRVSHPRTNKSLDF